MDRIRISDETLNCYGTWIKTDGIIIEQFQKNPVMLWMHLRGIIIGYMKDIRIENEEITAEPFFDEIREESRIAKKQWEKGSLRMGSPGFDIIETSDAPGLLKEGQTRPTITKCKLVEFSLVDIGGNDNNIRLTYANKELKLSHGEDCEFLPLLNQTKTLKRNNMNQEIQAIALMLGLSTDTTLADVQKEIRLLLEHKTANKTLRENLDTLTKEMDAIKLSGITTMVDEAIKSGKISADKKEHFVNLGKAVGSESLKLTIDSMYCGMRPSTILGKKSTGTSGRYENWSQVPPEELKLMREENPDEYRRLYKAEFGCDCII